MARTLTNKKKENSKIFPNTIFMSKHNIECLAKKKEIWILKNKKSVLLAAHTLHGTASFCIFMSGKFSVPWNKVK